MELADIIDDASDAVKAAVQAAYDAGRVAGRREATEELKDRMLSVLGEPSPKLAVGNRIIIEPSPGNGRATPGSVKPTVERMLSDAQNGLTAAEIADRAGFKFNSVRGTLWSLGKEGFAEQRDGRWYVIQKDEGSSPKSEKEPSVIE